MTPHERERRFGNWLLAWGFVSLLYVVGMLTVYADEQFLTDPCYTCAQSYAPGSWSHFFYCVLGLGCW